MALRETRNVRGKEEKGERGFSGRFGMRNVDKASDKGVSPLSEERAALMNGLPWKCVCEGVGIYIHTQYSMCLYVFLCVFTPLHVTCNCNPDQVATKDDFS